MNKKGLRQEVVKQPNGATVIHIVRDVGNETVLYATVYSFEIADKIFDYLYTKE